MNWTTTEWRRLVFASWALFALSFVLPAYTDRWPPSLGSLFGGDEVPAAAQGDPESGWQAFAMALIWGDRIGKASALTNLLMLASLATLRTRWTRRRLVGGRGPPLVLGGAGVLNLVYWPIWVAGDDRLVGLLVGYWLWAATFLGAALGLWMLARERESQAGAGAFSEGDQ